jgi:hypothetical protein
MHQSDDNKHKRGPYKSQAVIQEESRRESEMLSHPDVTAFAEAIAKIKDPKKLAHIEWLIEVLSHNRLPRR